jgi:hypothetical protein
LNSRERVLAAIEHREPDRVPIDLGGTIMSGIMAQALAGLRRHVGLEDRPPKVYEVYQMLGEVEPDLIERYDIDVVPLEPLVMFFGIPRRDYKPWRLFDGTEVLVPGRFNPEADHQRRLVLREGGKAGAPVVALMPADGFYFDRVEDQSLSMDFAPPPLAETERQFGASIPAERLEHLAREAERLRETDKAVFCGSWRDFGPPQVGNIPNWLCLMVTDPEYVGRLFEMKTEADLANLARLHSFVGEGMDVFGIDGQDFGTQRAEAFSPELFERLYLPYYTRINAWVHEHTGWKTWKHCCGSIPGFMPHLVRSGLDCINPVQTSAAGMGPEGLKRRHGGSITFWGGGVDTQRTLAFGTPEEVYDEVRERIRVFAPGGGFVFNPVHNVQANTPPENIDAMFQAARDGGHYPMRDDAGP